MLKSYLLGAGSSQRIDELFLCARKVGECGIRVVVLEIGATGEDKSEVGWLLKLVNKPFSL
mgnify:CR=1 FL=1